MQHTAIYLRVSSRAQDVRSQEPDLKRWVDAYANGGTKWYSDKLTGTTMDRPGWNRLQRDINGGKVSVIAVWRLDRLGRTASGLTALFEDLQRRKINLVSIKDGIDLGTASGRLMANVLASVAAYENEVRSERICAGQQVARAAGKRWGGSKRGRRISVTDEQVASVLRLRMEGTKITAIGRSTGLSRPTVYSILETEGRSAGGNGSVN